MDIRHHLSPDTCAHTQLNQGVMAARTEAIIYLSEAHWITKLSTAKTNSGSITGRH